MFASLDPLSLGILGTVIGTVAGVITGAVVRQVLKGRTDKRDAAAAGSVALADRIDKLDERLGKVEQGQTVLNTGLFGEDTPFGRQGGFVPKVLTTLEQHGKKFDVLVAEMTPNGGHSMKDDSTAIRQQVAPHEEGGTDG